MIYDDGHVELALEYGLDSLTGFDGLQGVFLALQLIFKAYLIILAFVGRFIFEHWRWIACIGSCNILTLLKLVRN